MRHALDVLCDARPAVRLKRGDAGADLPGMWVTANRRLKAAGVVALVGAVVWLGWAIATPGGGESDFMPHGFCYLWNPRIVWLNVISDGLIALAYYCIPLILVYFIRKNRGLPFNRIFWMFGGFILACGTTHALEIWNVWHGNYLLAGVVKALTAAVSVLTTAMLIPLIPKVISLPSRMQLEERNRELEREIVERKARDAQIEAPLRKRVAVGFVVTIAVAGLMGFLAWRNARQIASESDWVAHTQTVLTRLESTLQHVLDVETGARGFVLVGQELFLQPYEAGQRELIQDLAELRRLTADNPAQQRRLEALQPRIAAAVEFTHKMVAARKQTKAPPGTEELLQNKKSVDAVRAEIQTMQETENQLLAQRGQASRAGRRQANWIATGGMLMGSLILAAAGFFVNREIGVSASARAQIASLNATLEERVARRTAALNSEIAERKRAETRNVQLAAIVESSADAIFSTDLSGVVLSWNPGAERMFGYSEAEAVGKPLMIVPPDRNEELNQLNLEIMQGRQIARDGTMRRRKDGTRLEVSLIMSPLRDGSGRVTGASVIARDITERRRAEAVRERLAALVDSSDDAIIGKDLNSVVTAWNRGAEKVFGYSAEEMMGQSIRKLFPAERAEEEVDIMSRIRRGESVEHYETVRVRKDGSRIDVSVTISPIKDSSGTIVGVSKIARDITESKQAGTRLAQHAEELARQARELAVSRLALQEQTVMFELVLSSMGEGLIAADRNAHFLIWNDAAKQMMGRGPADVPSEQWTPHYGVFLPDGVTPFPPHDLPLVRALRGESALVELIVEQPEPAGKVHLEVAAEPMRDAQGALCGGVAVLRDVTERHRAEAALRDSEERFQAMANGIPQLAWMAEADGHIFWYNQRWYDYTGTTAQEMEGWGWQSVHDPARLPAVLEGWKGSIASGQPFDMEFPLRGADGKLRMFLTRVMPVKDVDGRVVRWFGTNTDISERKLAEERLERLAEEVQRSRTSLENQGRMLESVLDSIDEGLVAADENGKYLIWNRAAERIAGYGPAELGRSGRPKSYDTYLPDGTTPLPVEDTPLYRAIRGEACSAELILRNPKAGDEVWIEATASPVRGSDGVARGGVVAFRDISQRKADEQEIQRLNENLEHKVAERTAQLEVANQELEAFSYSVSHDLRAPLRHIIGFSQMLREECGPTLDPNAHRYLDRIQAGTQKMGLLVDELLNLARVGRHVLNRQPAQLTAIVEEVAAMLEPETTGRQVEWVIDELPEVACDPVLVKQVFQNLMANALKFTRPRGNAGTATASEATGGNGGDGHAVIGVSCREENGQQVFVVRDNGIGFDMKYVDKLFGVFQRLHRADEFEGTGIGLATVQRIVHKHGGRVWAEGGVGKGATFSFTLSAAKQAKPKNNAAGAGGRS